ncbi:MAG: DUF6377 domain-containing protein [Paludibacter sp.]|nr:DUF6377 domain-containing protein [Paludibacter sp.]
MFNLNAQNYIDYSITDLDKVVAEQQKYTDLRENRITELKQKLGKTKLENERYKIESQLFEEYLPFTVDSALYYAKAKLISAKKLERNDFLNDSRMNITHVLILASMYKEASDSLKNINRSFIPDYLLSYYFCLQNTLYEAMSNYTIIEEQKKAYKAKAIIYKDSILWKNPNDVYIHADKLSESGDYNKALKVLENFFSHLDPKSHDIAISAYAISDIYRQQGNSDEEKKYLIISAISDIKWGVKEYISLRKLATILYEEGDLDRAYNYMNRSLEDATFCNARLRTIEVTQTLPIIEQAYQAKASKESRHTFMALIGVSILSAFLIFMIIYVRIQMKRLSQTRSELDKANKRLQHLNTELNTVNEQLQLSNNQLNETNYILSATNKSLSEANHIKETYIVRFMTECSVYIDKMDNYRRMLNKQAIAGKLENLFNTLKSTTFINDELESFYNTFDETFLHLFPSFVEKFNQLLPKEDRIIPKKENSLTTELRIFALIRLGITDTERIAFFLRCSRSTVYSYRSRLRLKSMNPDAFEDQIMGITSF